MKSTKRKIVALSTAFVMAFALVAAMLPATVSEAAVKSISSVDFTITKPVAGVTVAKEGFFQTNRPVITSSTEGVDLGEEMTAGNWVEATDSFDASNPPSNWYGTFEDGKDYYVCFWSMPQEGYTYDNSITVTVNGTRITDFTNSGGGELYVYAKVSCGDAPAPDPDPETSSVPVKDGYADQTIASGAPIVIGFDSPFENFNNGTEQGEVYIDGALVPSQYISAESGSTIITVAQEYLSQLAEGAHTMIVKFLDGSEGQASFTISSSAAASDGTSSSTTSTASATSSTSTTTKASAAKTADALPYAGLALVFVGASAIGVIAYRRKNL